MAKIAGMELVFLAIGKYQANYVHAIVGIPSMTSPFSITPRIFNSKSNNQWEEYSLGLCALCLAVEDGDSIKPA